MTTRQAGTPSIPVSWGELIDKITILEIKCQKIVTKDAVANLEKELQLLHSVAEPVLGAEEIAKLKLHLGRLNQELWDIENFLRDKEAKRDFGSAFVELARSVYLKNDERAALKAKINRLLKSELVEEKCYAGASIEAQE